MRLDRALYVRGLARSRSHAQEMILAGDVTVAGETVVKASTSVPDDAVLAVEGEGSHYVSRAAHKLSSVLDACANDGLEVAGLRALDAGASTGGFTQVLLEHGAAHVLAIDVGHGQLARQIRADPRVTAREGTNVRNLSEASPGAGVDLVVADLSFIALSLVIEPLVAFAGDASDFLLMVKPQFEVGKGNLSARGVVTDAGSRVHAVVGVAHAMLHAGLSLHRVVRSALPGPQGNVEYFLWGSKTWQARGHDMPARPLLAEDTLERAISREVGVR